MPLTSSSYKSISKLKKHRISNSAIKQIKKKTSTKEKAIEDENGEITKNPRTILKIKSDYYENLYKKNLSAEEMERENEYLKDLSIQ